MGTQLLLNGHVYSSASPYATAMAISDGMITWVGSDDTGRALHPGVDTVDLAGSFVAPAFVDSHVHTTALGLALSGLDLTAVASLAECLAAVRQYASRSDDPVVWGSGWDESRWPERRAPTTAEIDECAPGKAVYLARVDAHSAACSSAIRNVDVAIVSADGYSAQHPLTSSAHHIARRAARMLLTPEMRRAARTRALDHAASCGIVAVHECGGPDISGTDDFAELMAFEHGVEVRGYWGEAVDSPDAARALIEATGAHALGGDLFIDGALGSHTAWLTEPYADCPGYGNAYLDVDTIAAHIGACTSARIQSGFHAIGDAAVSAAATAFERVAQQLGGPAVAALGHRLEHAEMMSVETIEKLARFGVIASVQPMFDAMWGGPDGLYVQRLGRARAAAMNPFAALASAGVSLALSSDAPVTRLAPWSMIKAAVHHRTEGSGISPRAAFSAATRGAWRAGGVRDGLAGTLVPGAPATYALWETGALVVSAPKDAVQRWSTDPRSGVPSLPLLDPESPEPQCVRSVHRGKVVYER